MNGTVLKQCGKLALGSLLLSAALTASAAIKEVAYVESTGAQWINTHYVPTCTDTFEMKVRFSALGFNQGLWCARGSDTAKNTMTCFAWQSDNKLRLDRNTNTGTYSPNNSIGTTADHVIVANYSTLKATIDGGSETTMASGDFTCGGVLTLLASHQAYGSFGNFSKMKLYSFKVTDKDGNVVREFVPAKDTVKGEYGVYDKMQGIFYAGRGNKPLQGGDEVAGAAELVETFIGYNVINVTGNDNITWAQATAGIAFDASKPTVKIGSGTVQVGAELEDYAGDILIREGFFSITAKGALGTGVGKTYVDGGTLINRVANGVNNGSAPSFPNEEVFLRGTGCNDNGALKEAASNVDWCRKIILDGETLINAQGQRLDMRSSTFNMNGFALTTKGDVRYVNTTIQSPADVTCNPTYFEFQASGTLGTGFSDTTYTIKTGTTLGFWESSTWWPCKIDMEDGTGFSGGSGSFKYAGTDNRNILSGPITFEGKTKNNLSKNVQMQLRGKLTGAGGIVPGTTRGGYLQFLDQSANDFKGGVAAQGLVENDQIVGGIVTYMNGAIPAGETAGPITLDTAKLEVRTINTVDLPTVAVTNAGEFVHDGKLVTCNVKSLVKTGGGTFDVKGPFHVKGEAEIKGGTLRCGSQIPDYVSGLYWAGNTTGNNNKDLTTETAMKAHDDYKGVDASGMTYAYSSWPGGKGFYHYFGYFKVPGEEGTSKRCRFISNIFRNAKLWVDDVKVLQVDDSNVVTPANAPPISWSRHYWTDPKTLTAGWHKVAFYMYGTYNTDNGPSGVSASYAAYGLWPKNFGLGVDFNSSATLANAAKDANGVFEDRITNSTSYVKFNNNADMPLRAKVSGVKTTTEIDPSKYRPTFDGNVAFAPGTVFDLNDYEPYTVMTIPSLTGKPTITNGAVNVMSTTWTLRASDLASDVPLTVAANATLTFGGAKTVVVDGDPGTIAALKKMGAGKPLFRAANVGDYTFTLSSRLKEINCQLTVAGDTVSFSRCWGLQIVVR